MSNIIAGNGGRGRAVTAITVALILIMMASPVILTTTEAFAASKSKKDCKGIEIRTLESSSVYYSQAGNTITIGTSQDEYSVKVDYFRDTGTYGVTYIKNVVAHDPPGQVLLPGGETITITLQTNAEISYHTHVTLYNDKVSDCQILSGHVKDEDKMAFEVSIEQNEESPSPAKLTVQVPDASDVDKHFTKLLVTFPSTPESREFYLISHRVHVS